MTFLQRFAFVAGASLWVAATALLLENAWITGQWTVTNLSMPLLTLGTVLAAVFAHRHLFSWRPVSGVLFLFLALLGSVATIYGTLGRQAESRDLKQALAIQENKTLQTKEQELKAAQLEEAKECTKIGPKCQAWQARVDKLTGETGALRPISPDARADSVAQIAGLFGFDPMKAKAIAQTFDPLLLPLFLEAGSILFMAAAFPRAKAKTLSKPEEFHPIAEPLREIHVKSFTKEEAKRDLKTLKEAGSGQFLAQRWSVSPATVSRWLKEFQTDGAIQRNRRGKNKLVTISPPNRKALTFGARRVP
jgi:hypothetical protein